MRWKYHAYSVQEIEARGTPLLLSSVSERVEYTQGTTIGQCWPKNKLRLNGHEVRHGEWKGFKHHVLG